VTYLSDASSEQRRASNEGPLTMLTLSRQVGQSLLIGEDIEIYLVDVGGGQARLAIRAPRHLTIMREELVSGHAEAAPTRR